MKSDISIEEMRKAVAELIGANVETWPEHGNVPLAITATVAVLRNKNRELEEDKELLLKP